MLVAPSPSAAVPEWKTVLGGRFFFVPIDRAMMRRARRAALAAIGRDEHGPEPEDDEAAATLEDISDALSHALIMAGLRDWDPATVGQQRRDEAGDPVTDEAGAPVFEPQPFTLDNLANLLTDPVIFDAIDAAYVVPFARRERAKNGFAASPNGTGAAATPASDTAISVATPASAVDAANAPIDAKRRRARKPKASGKS